MKITEIYIGAFGGLKDYTLKLDDNFTVIFGENEKGKTTVMTFIRAMFYGTGKKVGTLQNSIRAKYTPFDSSTMGGRITFEHGKKRYRLERQFNKSDSTDKITLTDLDTGESTIETNDVGVKFFGIGADAFEKSMFIGVTDNADNNIASGELNAKLSAVALTGNANTSFEKIEKRLSSAKEKLISKSSRAGSLVKLKNDITDLEQRLDKANEDAKIKVELNSQISKLKEEFSLLAKKYKTVKKLYDSKEDIKNTEKLAEYLALKEKLDKLNDELTLPDGKIIDGTFVNKFKFCTSKITQQEEKCSEIEEDIKIIEKSQGENNSLSPEEANKKIEETKSLILSLENEKAIKENELNDENKKFEEAKISLENSKDTKKPFNLILLVFGILFILIGVAVGVLLGSIFFLVSGIGIILLILSFIIRPKDESKREKAKEKLESTKEKLNEIKNELSTVSQNITLKSSELNLLISMQNVDKNAKEKTKAELETKKEKLNTEKEKLFTLNEEFSALVGSFGISEEELSEKEPKIEEQKQIKLTLNILSKDLGNISYEEAKQKLENSDNGEELSNIDFDKVLSEKEKIEEELSLIKQNITEKETTLKTSFRNSEQPEIIKREIDLINEKARQMFEYYTSCDIANEVLAESFAEIRRSYGSALEEKTLENFALITGGKYKNVGVDKSLNLTAESKDVFGMKEIGYLSTGTIDQAFLSLRLAICSLMAKDMQVPVMLDDSLSNYDDERTKKAIDFLKLYAKENQVLLFTCHSSVCDFAKNSDVVVTDL